MKNKDNILKLALSVLMVVFGAILLLDQLNVKYIDEFFTPWYTIVILFVACCLLAYAIVKKAPFFYILSMLFASIYLVISINFKVKDLNVGKIIAIIPLFIGIGIVLADKVCKWSPKAMRFGLVTTIASAIVLVSTILDVWKYVIPIVVILIGVAYIIFGVVAIKQESKVENDDHFVTYKPMQDEKSQESVAAEDENKEDVKKEQSENIDDK